MSKHRRIFIWLGAAVFWAGMAALAASAVFKGLGVHETLAAYVRNEIAVNYNIDDAALKMLSSEHNAYTVCCLYKATDAAGDEHYIRVTFLRHTLLDRYKLCSITLL